MTEPTGRLIGIARRPAPRAPMTEIASGEISESTGLAGDHKGAKFPRRQITVLAIEDWQSAVAGLDRADLFPDLAPPLPWTARRANLLVEGVVLPRAKGGRLAVGPVLLEVTAETSPCRRMDEAAVGLLKALARDWRGGVTCRVLQGGVVSIGDPVRVTLRPQQHIVRLPG